MEERRVLDFDPRNSKAVLIGAPQFKREPKLAALPEVSNNILDLSVRLIDSKLIGFADLVRIEDRPYPELVEAVRDALADEDTDGAGRHLDCLFVYYAGHGLVASDRSLRLAAANTTLVGCDDDAVPFKSLANLIDACRAKVKVVVLDCCFSGRAVDAGGVKPLREWPDVDVGGTMKQISGSFTIAACHAAEKAIVPHHARNTGFTGVLLNVLDEGVQNARTEITVRELFDAVVDRCVRKPLPKPTTVNRERGDTVRFVKNSRPLDPSVEANVLARRLVLLLNGHPLQDGVVTGMPWGSVRKLVKYCNDWLIDLLKTDGHAAAEDPLLQPMLSQPEFRKFYREWVEKPAWNLLEENSVITIDSNGNGHCEWTREIECLQPVWMMWRAAFGDKKAPQDDFQSISLRVRRGDEELPVVPLLDEPFSKEFLFFFVPALEPGHRAKHTISWMWPKMFAPLVLGGEDTWGFEVVSAAATIPAVNTTFRVHSRVGRLSIDNTGWGGGDLEDPDPPVKEGIRSYRWVMKDVPHAATAQLKLKRIAAGLVEGNGGAAQ